jgi:hypothetical protein
MPAHVLEGPLRVRVLYIKLHSKVNAEISYLIYFLLGGHDFLNSLKISSLSHPFSLPLPSFDHLNWV